MPGFFVTGQRYQTSAVEQCAEALHNIAIDIAFEGHSHIDQLVWHDPFPCAELGLGGVDVDIGVDTVKAQGHPFLPLTTILPVPQPVRE